MQNYLLSIGDAGIILISNAQAPKNGHVVRLALLDFEGDSEKIAKDPQALDCEGRDPTKFD